MAAFVVRTLFMLKCNHIISRSNSIDISRSLLIFLHAQRSHKLTSQQLLYLFMFSLCNGRLLISSPLNIQMECVFCILPSITHLDTESSDALLIPICMAPASLIAAGRSFYFSAFYETLKYSMNRLLSIQALQGVLWETQVFFSVTARGFC